MTVPAADVRRERRLGFVTLSQQRYDAEMAADWLDAVKRGVCPFCNEGPFTVVCIHVAKKHGIDRFQLRDMLGITYGGESLCDPTYAKACSEQAKKKLAGTRIYNAPRRKPKFSEAAKARLRALSRTMAEERLAEVAGRDAAVAELISEGRLTYAEIAERHSISIATITAIRRRRGLPSTPGRQPIREQRTCSLPGCDRPHKGHGLCRPHLRARRRAEGTSPA